jgi:hypothetical protein
MNLSILPDLGVLEFGVSDFAHPFGLRPISLRFKLDGRPEVTSWGQRFESAVKSSILAIPAIVAIWLCGPLPVPLASYPPPLPVSPHSTPLTPHVTPLLPRLDIGLTPFHPIFFREPRRPVPDHSYSRLWTKTDEILYRLFALMSITKTKDLGTDWLF